MADQKVPSNGIFLNKKSIMLRNFFPKYEREINPIKIMKMIVIIISNPGILKGK